MGKYVEKQPEKSIKILQFNTGKIYWKRKTKNKVSYDL